MQQTLITIILQCGVNNQTMMALSQDLTRQIKAELKFLNTNKQINSFLIFAEQKIGLSREQIISCNKNSLYFSSFFYYFFCSVVFGILVVYLIFGWNRDLVCNSIGFLIPAYAS